MFVNRVLGKGKWELLASNAPSLSYTNKEDYVVQLSLRWNRAYRVASINSPPVVQNPNPRPTTNLREFPDDFEYDGPEFYIFLPVGSTFTVDRFNGGSNFPVDPFVARTTFPGDILIDGEHIFKPDGSFLTVSTFRISSDGSVVNLADRTNYTIRGYFFNRS